MMSLSKLTCKICGFQSDYSLTSHISRKHMDVNLYRKMYPNDIIQRSKTDAVAKMKATKAKKDTKNKHYKQKCLERAKEWDDVLQCKICGFTSYASLISHIIKEHEITIKEYKLRFPDMVVQRMSREQRENHSKQSKEWFKNSDNYEFYYKKRSFPSEIKHWTNKGYDIKTAKEKVSEFQTKQSLKQNNPETREKRRKKMAGDKNHMSLKSLAKKHNVSLEEAKKYTPCFGRVGEKHPMYRKHHTDKAKEKISKNLSKTVYTISEGEIELRQVLKEKCEKIFSSNLGIAQYNCDIVFEKEKVIVEYMGEFWHPYPEKFEPDWIHPRTKETAQKMWERDNRKIDNLKSLGFDVIIIRASEWKANRDEVILRIKNAINRK